MSIAHSVACYYVDLNQDACLMVEKAQVFDCCLVWVFFLDSLRWLIFSRACYVAAQTIKKAKPFSHSAVAQSPVMQ